MYAITGATGNTGKVIAERLLARGEKVRAIGRDADRLASLVQKGAEAFVADVTDSSAMARAFAGTKAAYVMIPPNLTAPDVGAYQEQVSEALARALEKAGVEYAVLLSSVGADKAERTGPVVGLHHFEQKLNGIAKLKALFLRADLKLPFIATRDIGAFAAEMLLTLNFSGKQTRELLGQRDVSYNETAAVVGKAIGKSDLVYSQLPPSQLKPALVQMGMSSSMADLLLEMAEALNSGYMKALEPRSAENTTPTSIEQFVAEEFVPRFTGRSASA